MKGSALEIKRIQAQEDMVSRLGEVLERLDRIEKMLKSGKTGKTGKAGEDGKEKDAPPSEES